MFVSLSIFVSLLVASLSAYGGGELFYRQYARINDPYYGIVGNSLIGFDIEGSSRTSGGSGYLYQVDARISEGIGDSTLFSVPQLYWRTTSGGNSYTIGRKILDWHPSEKIWDLAIINHARGFNLLEEEEEGIVGLHFSGNKGNFAVQLFASPLYVPQLNPSFIRGENNDFVGRNEWASIPPQTLRSAVGDMPINYTFKIPPLEDILLSPSFGIRGKYLIGDAKYGTELSAYVSYKPERSLRLLVTSVYHQGANERSDTTVDPFVNYNLVFGVGVKETYGDLHLRANLDFIQPDIGTGKFMEREGYRVEQTYSDQAIATVSSFWKNNYIKAGINFLEILSGEVNTLYLFDVLPRWRSAVALFSEYVLDDHWEMMFNYKYDLKFKDATLIADASHLFSKDLSLGVGVEMVQSESRSSFWRSYRGNDSIYAQLNYAF